MSLPGPLFFRDINVGTTLLFTKAQQHFCCSSVVLSFTHWSRLKIWIATFHRDGVLITIPLMIRYVVRDVDRCEVVQVHAICLCPPDRQLRSSVLGSRNDCAFTHFFWRLLLSNGLLAMVDHRASSLLNDSLLQDNTVPSMPGIWL